MKQPPRNSGRNPRNCSSPVLGLAPMDGVTDLPARLWISLASLPDFAITPFFRVTQGYPLHKLPATYCPEALLKRVARPLLFNCAVRPQLMGNCPYELARFSRFLLEFHESVDLNFGCPAPKVVGHNGGSGLIKCTQNLQRFLDCYFDNVPPGRTSIKTRLGFECKSEALSIIETFDKFPILELTLHGRTRAQKYTGKSDWELIAKLAAQAHFPISVSGDLCSALDLSALESIFPNVQTVLVGRGAVRNPWLFQEFKTRDPVTLEWPCLGASLRVFLLINDLCLSGHHQILMERIRGLEIAGNETNSSQEKYWKFLEAELRDLSSTMQESASSSKSSLARLKMIWNFLRTSLPEAFMNPAMMRTASVEEFFAFLDKFVQIECESMEFLTLKHNPKHNWIFSGERSTDDST